MREEKDGAASGLRHSRCKSGVGPPPGRASRNPAFGDFIFLGVVPPELGQGWRSTDEKCEKKNPLPGISHPLIHFLFQNWFCQLLHLQLASKFSSIPLVVRQTLTPPTGDITVAVAGSLRTFPNQSQFARIINVVGQHCTMFLLHPMPLLFISELARFVISSITPSDQTKSSQLPDGLGAQDGRGLTGLVVN